MVCLYLLPLQAAAVLCDLYDGRIPNELIAGGLIMGGAWQWSVSGLPGLAQFAGGALLPLVLLGMLHWFRMMGAGDIKLLMMSGGFLGVSGSLKCICCSFLAAGVWALAILAKQHVLQRRLSYLAGYLKNCRSGGKWSPYIERGEDAAYIHFSIPVLLGSLPVMGGIF